MGSLGLRDAAGAATPHPNSSPSGEGPAPVEIVATASPAEWKPISPADLLVMDLAPDAAGKPRRVVMQMMPPPFSQGWVANIRTLAAAHWWDGLSINRVQDNYVVQWGDPNGEDKAKARPLPAGLKPVPQSEYVASVPHVPKGYAYRDAYAPKVGVTASGWSFAADDRAFWPVHCYGMVGVGRDLSPDTGSGAELYVIIGHAPRHLDRNIALVGRVIEGIEHLSSLPRGTGALGFYETAAERVPIVSIRPGREISGLPGYEYLSPEAPSFARYADARPTAGTRSSTGRRGARTSAISRCRCGGSRADRHFYRGAGKISPFDALMVTSKGE